MKESHTPLKYAAMTLTGNSEWFQRRGGLLPKGLDNSESKDNTTSHVFQSGYAL